MCSHKRPFVFSNMSIFSASQTRSHVARDYAVFAPESHVPANIAGWSNTQTVILIGPRIGAKFAEYFVAMSAGATSAAPPSGTQRFVYVLEGSLTCMTDSGTYTLQPGGYIYLPPDLAHQLTTQTQARAVVVEKPYVPTKMVAGDPDVRVKTLLPDDLGFDMAMNIMAFQAGAALSLVEVHVMEHGLLMLDGALLYRLGESYYPVQAGDAMYLAPYCPQWCAAFGKQQARYLLYKDWNRAPFGY